MPGFDSLNYDIEGRLPEWWKGFGALEPLNEYTQHLIAGILQALLTNIGVVQPLNCWKSIPEEYTWYHHYTSTDDYLTDEHDYQYLHMAKKHTHVVDKATTILFQENKIVAKLPNTKRNCNAKIQLKLTGTDVLRTNNKIDSRNRFEESNEIIEQLVIQNADQQIILKNIPSVCTIEIFTEDNEILIDGVRRPNLVEGSIKKIKPVIKNSTYKQEYTGEGLTPVKDEEDETKILYYEDIEKRKYYKASPYKDIYYKEAINEETGEPKGINEKTKEPYLEDIDIEDENKKTEITFDSSKTVNFDLQIYLLKPTYTTQQNIRIASVSAFPIEWVRLYGYFCHPFNKKSGYKFLWEKKYTRNSRTVYDRITKQYDCERFFVQVKFYGIGVPLEKGFPQEFMASNPAFQLNPMLDKWGKIYGLQRRIYRTDITEDEEPYTFPEYYNYPVEQDYWYEERMVNEYQYDDDSVNALFIKDTNFNNIGEIRCIYPFNHDIWVYTETINPETPIGYNLVNIPLSNIEQDIMDLGVEWETPKNLLAKRPIYVELNPSSDETAKLNNQSYRTKKLTCSFDLRPYETEIPHEVKIKGIELKFKTNSLIQSNTIRVSESSKMIIPYFVKGFEDDNDDIITFDKIELLQDEKIWLKEKGYYTIGGEDNLFMEKEITREQLFEGNDGLVQFELIFQNDNNFLKSHMYIEDLVLNIYYEMIPTEYTLNVTYDKEEILPNEEITMNIEVENTGDVKVYDKEILVVVPPELKVGEIPEDEVCSYNFDLDLKESFTIRNIKIAPRTFNGEVKTGLYDILVICEENIYQNEILIRGGEL